MLEEGCVCEVNTCRWGDFWENVPTDLLPTMAILRCFCCGGMVTVGSEREWLENYDVVLRYSFIVCAPSVFARRRQWMFEPRLQASEKAIE